MKKPKKCMTCSGMVGTCGAETKPWTALGSAVCKPHLQNISQHLRRVIAVIAPHPIIAFNSVLFLVAIIVSIEKLTNLLECSAFCKPLKMANLHPKLMCIICLKLLVTKLSYVCITILSVVFGR